VERVARALQGRGRTVYVDRWYLPPGQPWPQALEQVLLRCGAVATFLGPYGMGDWQRQETYLALDRQKREGGFPVIPVLLAGADPALDFLSLNTWVDLRETELDHPVSIEILDAALCGQPPGHDLQQRVAATLATVCPYRGLLSFREEDSAFFFGKEEVSGRLETLLRQHQLIAVVGASGAGKSSVVRAGLLPRLRKSKSPVWDVVTLVPNDRPLHTLSEALMRLLEPTMTGVERRLRIGELANHLDREKISLRDLVDEVLTRQMGTDRLLLVVDQWEELYSLCQQESIRRRFIDLLLEASETSPLSVVLTLRGDFYNRLLEHRPLMDRIDNLAIVNVPAMNRDELRKVIEKPAERVALSFESGLIDRILNDVEKQPGSLPLLEFALKEMWDGRHGSQLKHDAYEAMGRVEGAVARRAELIYGNLKPAQQDLARRIFVQLVKPGEGAEDTRRRATYAELGEAAHPIALELTKGRLIVTSRDEVGATVEVAHEALIRHWDRLRGWMEEVREFRAWQERLRTSIRQWMISGRAEDALLRGVLLEEAERRLQDPPCDVSEKEREFIQASVELRVRMIAEAHAMEQETCAKSLLDSLGKAEITQVPCIIQELEGCGQLADALLAEQLASIPRGGPERLNYALAGLPREPALLDELTDELLQCDSHAFPVIRHMLAFCKERFIDRLWDVVLGEDPADEPGRLRAAAALAAYAPDGNLWGRAAELIARLLASTSPALLGPWQKALQPAKKHLLDPLARIYRDREVDELQRAVACSILADYASDQPEVLTNLICDADPRHCAVLFPILREHENVALGMLERKVTGRLKRVQDNSEALTVARRKAAAGMTMLRLGERTKLLDVLRVCDDPESLTQFVHRCRAWGVAADELRECLAVVDNRRQSLQGDERRLEDRVLYGLLLALGEYPLRAVAEKHQGPLVEQLGDWYRQDPSSAIHGACGWLLRHWQRQMMTDAVDRTAIPYDPRREWFTREIAVPGPGSSHQSYFLTFVVFYPGEYWIGSPDREPDRNNDECRRQVALTRPFALLDRPVTRGEVDTSGFRSNIDPWGLSGQGPMVGTNWYDSVRFCRWLGLQAGIPEQEQPYADPKTLTSRGLVRKAKYPPDPSPEAEGAPLNWPLRLDRLGFRLPTEAEWEIACRGGMVTPYAFGRDSLFLEHYAWFLENSGRQARVPREKRPNSRGLFDMSGNVLEWCHDRYGGCDLDIVTDPIGPPSGSDRVLRGGSWNGGAASCRAAYRDASVPTYRTDFVGFRLALSLSGAPDSADLGVAKED
jgi:formylglycine-generating enzyme required for sulfatase activity